MAAFQPSTNFATRLVEPLATRKSWPLALLTEVKQWRLKASDIPSDVVQQLRAYDDPPIASLAEETLGKAVIVSSEEKIGQMKRLQTVLAENRDLKTSLMPESV